MSGHAEPVVFLGDAEATEAYGAHLAAGLQPGTVLLLEGPLGAGKTTLVRGVVRALGGDPAEVCSPTFTLLETYEVSVAGIRRLHHSDLYRLRGRPQAPLEEIGLDEAFDDRDGVTAVEWPESWPWLGEAGERVVRVRLTFRGVGREVSVAWSVP